MNRLLTISSLYFLFLILINKEGFGETGSDSSKNAFFSYLSVNNGLSQNSVTCFLQDKQGFIWIGTYDGLNRYDGFSVTTKRHESANKNSLSDNRVKSLYEDINGNILIGTESGGLNIYNPSLDKFSLLSLNNIDSSEIDIKTICNDQLGNLWVGTSNGLIITALGSNKAQKVLNHLIINCVIRDKLGNMWIATRQGLYFCQVGSSFTNIRDRLILIKEVEQTSISAICEDTKGNIWLGENSDLAKIHFEGSSYPYIKINKQHYNLFAGSKLGEITGIQQDGSGDLWVSHYRLGLYQFDIDRGGTPQQKRIYSTNRPFCNITDNAISTILVDRTNVLWAGTFQKGVNYTNLSIKNIFHFYPLLSDQLGELGYKGKVITAVCDDGHSIWVGTANEGLFSYDVVNKTLHNYASVVGKKWISSMFVSRTGKMWIGTSFGLYCVDDAVKGKRELKLKLDSLNIHSICEDRYNNIWITTWRGVFIYNSVNGKMNLLNEKQGLSSRFTFLAYADPVFSIMWVTTMACGLNRIEYDSTGHYSISEFRHRIKQGNSLNSDYIWSIYRDNSNTMWLGTDAGLDRVQLDNKAAITSIKHIDHNMLRDRKILGILKDDEQNLWLSNSQGLFKYSPDNNEVKRYYYKDGLQSNTLTEAVYRNNKGIMYFGGINGLDYFNPKDIKDNPFPAQLALTEFKIFNQTVQAGEKISGHLILEKDINKTDKILLSYKENNFLLTFASLHFALPENNKFKYKLAGYDKDWIVTDAAQRFAAYSNLPSGSYDFFITASNNDGKWNENYKHINFIIQPAPWATWWAKLVYILLLLGLVCFVLKHYQTKQALENLVYNEKLEKEKVKELNELKLSFFTDITHELRTPLSLIIGPMKELLDKENSYDNFTRFRLDIVHNNSQRLFSLINQVLDLRKISSDSNRLFIANSDIIKTVGNIKDSFNWTAEQKNIRYDYNFDRLSFLGWYDKDKIEKVVFNLLANAFKYTPDGGAVELKLTIESATSLNPIAHVAFRDTGTGIDPLEIDKIFDMFYQGKKQSSFGSGIGLALSKKLIEMHHGEMTVTSIEHQGATFEIRFPLGIHSFNTSDIFESEIDSSSNVHQPGQKTIVASANVKKVKDKRSILLIEDNDDQLAYIKETIGDLFHVYDAKDGEAGLELANKYVPDIILTDLMMPNMDGIELCRHLKGNAKTSHIPIIIHSVKTHNEAIKLALEAGANDFVSKPADYRLLKLKITNILESAQHLLNNQYKQEMLTPVNVEVPDHDAVLLKQVIEVIEKSISDPAFSIETLSQEVSMSRMHLHRRLNDIIGKTASELVREIKMKRAAQLLESGSMRVSEVMLEVGISNHGLFNKYFKDIYGQTPNNYKKNR
ncbi:MAG TPA: two-component regulator propeller domain-containing protein [Puia sp.]|jgi:signal transduction histidine kinase/ligand-binding sensor domain-containing protein/DNA-binding response OmpR family regulator